MATVGAYEAKTHFSKLLERAEAGETITITKHGKPVAQISPTPRGPTPEEIRATLQRMRELRATAKPDPEGWSVVELVRRSRPS